MHIGLDCDEVLRNFSGALTKCYKHDFPTHNVLPWDGYDLAPIFPDHPNIKEYVYSKDVIKKIFLHSKPLEGAKEFVDQLRLRGHHVHIITSQPRNFEYDPAPITLEWFCRNDIPWDSFSFTREKWKITCDVLLDDAMHNLIPYGEHKLTAVAMDRPWNKDWKGHRIKTYDEFLNLINKL